MKLWLRTLSMLLVSGIAFAQESVILLCKGDAWNQFAVPRQTASASELVFRLELSKREIEFSDIAFGQLKGTLEIKDGYYASSVQVPENPLHVHTVAVFVNRVSGNSSILYWLEPKGSDRPLASFAGKCEKAVAKF